MGGHQVIGRSSKSGCGKHVSEAVGIPTSGNSISESRALGEGKCLLHRRAADSRLALWIPKRRRKLIPYWP
jgi:hypothetical protein